MLTQCQDQVSIQAEVRYYSRMQRALDEGMFVYYSGETTCQCLRRPMEDGGGTVLDHMHDEQRKGGPQSLRARFHGKPVALDDGDVHALIEKRFMQGRRCVETRD